MPELTLNAVTQINVDNSIEEQLVTFPFEDFDQPNIGGKIITKKFAKELVNNNRWSKISDHSILASVTFSSRILMFLLSQKKCVGIKYYLAVKEGPKSTMCLVGIDDKGNDLNCVSNNGKLGSIITDNSPDENTFCAEVAGTQNIEDYI